MRSNFENALHGIDLLEGGQIGQATKVQGDHGGLTGYRGITNATFQGWLLKHSFPSRPLSQMNVMQSAALLDEEFWTPEHCDDMPIGLDFCHFQWAMNHGDGGATFTLQKTLGLLRDGIIGPKTLAAVKAIHNYPMDVIDQYLSNQREWYQDRVAEDPSQRVFLQGWINRTIRVKDIIMGRPLSV